LLRETNSEISRREVIELLNSSKSHLFKKHLDKSLEMVDVVKIFELLGLYQERPIPYFVLVRKALSLSIYFIIGIILLFFLIRLLDFILI